MTPDTAALRALADTADTFSGYITIPTDTLRALCDAADEVERLRKAVWATEEIDRRAGMLAGVEAERDASRTAHAALVADLRALHTVKHECSPAVFLLYTDVLSLLARHAPEEGR